MGQAKARGTREQRVEQALKREQENQLLRYKQRLLRNRSGKSVFPAQVAAVAAMLLSAQSQLKGKLKWFTKHRRQNNLW